MTDLGSSALSVQSVVAKGIGPWGADMAVPLSISALIRFSSPSPITEATITYPKAEHRGKERPSFYLAPSAFNLVLLPLKITRMIDSGGLKMAANSWTEFFLAICAHSAVMYVTLVPTAAAESSVLTQSCSIGIASVVKGLEEACMCFDC